MIRYAIIGTGWITETFMAGTLETEEMVLAGVYSRDEEKGRAFAKKNEAAARGGEIRIYTDLNKLAEDPSIDAVYVASPNRFHVAQSRLMLAHKKHVICEKPIAIHPEALKELQDLAKEQGVIYIEAIMMQHLPQRKALTDALKELGRIYTAHIDFSQLSSKYQAFVDGKNPNIFNPEMCTGALEDLGIYCFYAIYEMFGKPEKQVIYPQFLSSGADCSGDVILFYEDKQVTVNYSKVGQARVGSQIMGDQGTLTIDLISQLTGMKITYKDGSVKQVWGEEEKNHLMAGEAKDFERFIHDPEGCRGEIEEAMEKAMVVCTWLEELRDLGHIKFVLDEDPHAI